MKWIVTFILMGIFIAGFCLWARAEEPQATTAATPVAEGMMKESMMQPEGKMHHEKKEGMHDMCCGMMQSKMNKEMVATGDGGVIVMAGNKLLKYDKNLNLVKEAEIKMDMECMKKMMDMKNCPMMKDAMQMGSPKEETSTEVAPTEATPAEVTPAEAAPAEVIPAQ